MDARGIHRSMSTPAESYLAVRVSGRVQGVGFRWWVQREARELGVRGVVRNAADGSVEIEMAAEPDALDRLRALLHEGPPAARVVEVKEIMATTTPPHRLPDSFEIGY